MSYTISLTRPAQKDLDDLHPTVRDQVLGCLDELARDPRPPGMKPMKERALRGSNRIHVGPNYCVAYRVDDKAEVVTVWLVTHRSRFYDVAHRRQG